MALITITTGLGCGLRQISKKVAAELNLEVYDDDRIQQEAVEMGYQPEDLKAFDEKAPGLFDRLLRRRPEIYDELMAGVIYEIARRGEGIIVGHGAFYFLKDFSCALHLRLHASKAFRVNRLAEAMKVSPQTALKVIENRDAELKSFLDFLFDIDWNDLSLYDLVINVDKIGLDAAIGSILQLTEMDHIQECSIGALDSMQKLSLLKRVEAAVLKDNLNPQELHIEVPQPGVVRLTGLINPMRTVAGVTELIQSVPGVSKVICEAERHPLAKM